MEFWFPPDGSMNQCLTAIIPSRAHLRNSSAAALTLSNEERSNFSQMASFPVVCLRSSIAALALSSLLVAMYTLAFLTNNAYAYLRWISALDQVTNSSREEYLDGLFADTSISPSNDNNLADQVRNVVDGKLGLWSEVSFKENRIEDLSEDIEGGGNARVRHVWRGTAQVKESSRNSAQVIYHQMV